MSTTVIPPTPPAQPAPQPAGPPPRSGPSNAAKAVAILVIVFGALVLVGAMVSAALSTIAAASVSTQSQTEAAGGVTMLDADVSAGSLRIEFADVTEAELDVTRAWGIGDWTLERSGSTLVIASPEGAWGSGWWWFGGTGDAVLRLPLAVERADADLTLSAGSIAADGEFDDIRLVLGAGSADVSGVADTIAADISAGSANVDLSDVSDADLSVSAGSLDVTLSGSTPEDVTLEVSAGSLTVTVPDDVYDIRSDVSAGDFENRIGSTAGAPNSIDVQVSAGQVVLRSR
ncbi:hypothetical protein [Microbacterium thalassium]|uniref:Adhesin domain-containing protein n=1 Tax=Microbacterium thalassium TaxID=362649 RepID=A0A7X0KU58_9MICO|nr:hypothetical protein [Microbacterium thalassium]MBB6390812.1 hypothetical protein [Microbacterium thalassium]GLK25920.1 hypothetical protein GCM10017607_32390 [Microbacterium thalassium]